jgi:CheY-like chemotaxis protein
MQQAAEEKNLFLRVHAAQTDLWAKIDTSCFQRALTHVIDNAVKFTESGGILVDVDGDDQRVYVRVMDSGVGIDDQFLEDLYDEFNQESGGLTREFEGLGVGLSVTERLISLMNGTITAHSEKAGGSMFTIALPRAFRPSVDQRAVPAILVAERDEDEQRILRYALEPYCRVMVVSDPERVVDFVSQGSCDGILINVEMYGEAYELIGRIRTAAGSHLIPIVGVGTHTLASEQDRLLAAGLDEYLPKPVTKKALLNALENLLAINQPVR